MEEKNIKSLIKQYNKKKPIRFHMPGHKGNKLFVKTFKEAGEDITELAFSDSLASPEGIILSAQNKVSKILETDKSWFLVDGSTSGVYAMLYAVKSYGNKIIINRNAHQSVYNACKLFNIEPIILYQNVKEDIILPPKIEDIENAIKSNPTAIGVLLTYPDYYGQTFNIENVSALLKNQNKLLLIDGAHGAHLKFCVRPYYAGKFADIYVDGVHKTLPCLTQTAVLNSTNNDLTQKIDEIINMFRTSSPSYTLMASIEYGECFMSEKGVELLSNLNQEVCLLKNRLSAKGITILETDDFLKFSLDCKSIQVSPYLAEKHLNKHNIYLEMNDGRYLLFLLSAMTSKNDLYKLEKFIYKIKRNRKLKNTYRDKPDFSIGERHIDYLLASTKEYETINLNDSISRVCYENIGIFPPCFPLLTAGEVITEEVIRTLSEAKYTYGVREGKIKVIKE